MGHIKIMNFVISGVWYLRNFRQFPHYNNQEGFETSYLIYLLFNSAAHVDKE